MKQLTIFRILTFILVPVAGLFGFFDVFIILGSLANPGFLVIGIVLASFVIYTFTSMQFLLRGINNERRCNPSLRVWIKRTAYLSLLMSVYLLIMAISVFFTSDIELRQYLEKFMETQAKLPPLFTIEFFLSMMRGMSWFMLVFGMILLDHIRINFILMKHYAHVFDGKKPE